MVLFVMMKKRSLVLTVTLSLSVFNLIDLLLVCTSSNLGFGVHALANHESVPGTLMPSSRPKPTWLGDGKYRR